MRTADFFRDLVSSQKGGVPRGICSVCSAHRAVLEAAFSPGDGEARPVLVESTVNQVNQFGGYTGMTPEAFRVFVASVAAPGRQCLCPCNPFLTAFRRLSRH